jgi:hypothetical protein
LIVLKAPAPSGAFSVDRLDNPESTWYYRTMTRKDQLERFAEATRAVQREWGTMVMYALDLNGLKGKELPGAELVLRKMRDDLNMITDRLFLSPLREPCTCPDGDKPKPKKEVGVSKPLTKALNALLGEEK